LDVLASPEFRSCAQGRATVSYVERGAWSDERLDDRFDHIDRRFDQIDRRFDHVDRRFDRLEQRLDFGLSDLRSIMIRFNGALIVGLLGVIAAILARGG
jgi:hypothetical protein